MEHATGTLTALLADLRSCWRAFRAWRQSEIPPLRGVLAPFTPGLPPPLLLPDESLPRIPDHFSPDDPLVRAIEGWSTSLREGRTTWGAVLLAEKAMFQGGGSDHSGLVLWSPIGEFDQTPERLRVIAQRVFAQRESTTQDPQLEPLREILRDPSQRVAGFWVPRELTDGIPLLASSLVLHRKHLPRGLLLRDLLPLRVGEEWDFPVAIPASCWGEPLHSWWTSAFDLLVLDRRISVLGNGRRGTELPDWVRHFFLRNRKAILHFAGFAGCLLLVSAALLQIAIHTPTSAHEGSWITLLRAASLAFPTGTLLLCLAWTIWVSWSWVQHLRLMEAYSLVWKERLFPWTRFFLLPTSLGFGFTTYSLSLKMLGSWVTLAPEFAEGQIRLVLSEGSETSEDPLESSPSRWATLGLSTLIHDRKAARTVLRDLLGPPGNHLNPTDGPA